MAAWRRHILYTRQSTRTTWKFRLAAGLVLVVLVVLLRGRLASWIGGSLVCAEDLAPSDVIVVENFDPNYLVFERAAALQRQGLAPRALVPVRALGDSEAPNPVSRGIAEVMARQARLGRWDIVPVRQSEPITLNTAAQLRDRLASEGVRSVIIVTPGFRSRRSALVLHAILDPGGILVHCAPVFGQRTPTRWAETWHGVQEVCSELIKLNYYQWYVLPWSSRGKKRE
jgi:hypothetical protein